MSKFGTLTGKNLLIGHGVPVAFPITLDPAPFEGSVVYADNGELRYSDGTNWLPLGTGPQGTQGTTGIQGGQGVQGDYGPGFTIIGSVPDVDAGGDPQATLNAAFGSANIGEGVIDDADDELWIYDGTNWVNIGSFRGVQGLQGSDGPQGVQGTIGNEGIQGERGYRGFQGPKGIQGLQGVQGDLGIQGIQGRRGPQGLQGIQGETGIQGLQGREGPQGIQGTTGIQGDTGIQGIQGFNGDDSGAIVQYVLGNAVTESPAPAGGFMTFNSPTTVTDTFTNVTKIWINDDDSFSNNLDGLFTYVANSTSANKAYVKVTKRDEPSRYVIFSVQDCVEDIGGTYWELDVTYLSGSATKEHFVEEDSGNPGTFISYPLLVAFDVSGDQGIQGVQGPIGPQGLQGLQGLQGRRGPQGVQGTTGIQGVQGLQGLQGVQGQIGPQGIQGIQGLQGLQGPTGEFGGISYDYDYSNDTTDADPTQGKIRLSSTNFTSANLKLWVDDEDKGAVNVMDGLATELSALTGSPKGYVRITTAADIYDQFLCRIDDITDKTGYWEFAVTRLSGATSLTDGDNVRLTFSRNGDRGLQGFQGTQGLLGFQGIQGLQGIQGEKGIQGSQGLQGLQGIQGESIQGTQGTQGITGSQGTQGLQGLQGGTGGQGTQGLQGITGIQGLQGLQGEQGQYGGLTFIWNFSNNTLGGTDPGTNNFKFNNANPTLATLITIDDIPADQYNSEVDDFLDFIANQPGSVKGYLKIQEGNYDDGNGPAGHHWLVYEITGWTWDSGSKNYGYWDVNYVDGNVTNWQSSVNAVHGPATLISFIPRGPAGIQGAQGTQGLQGLQGRTGAGIQGSQGTQGFSGLQGTSGSFGGVTFDYTFDSTTTNGDPGTGGLRINNSTLSSGTAMYIDNRDDNFIDISTFLATIDDSTSPIKGHFKITKVGSPEVFHLYTISSATPIGGYFNVACAHVDGNGSLSDGDDITITFARTGDAGATGATGPQGIQGVQGTQGFQGLQGRTGAGAQGSTGDIGPQGVQGIQGQVGATGSGSQGTQGLQGIQGDLGFQGLQGATGAGEAGAQGAAGEGIQGIQGLQGTDGEGAQGLQGVQGIQGNAGVGSPGGQGVQGGFGPQGIQGLQGIAGSGSDGTQGLQGIQGVQGSFGPQGLQGGDGGEGQPGPPGSQGLQGADGAGTQGIQGPQGADGVGVQGPGGEGSQGIQGGAGPQGEQGPGGTGPQGIQGTQGFIGPQGTGGTGPQGIQGVQGEIGAGSQGVQGDFGPQGTQGPQGTSGVTGEGVQGVQGPNGFQGPQGTQGTSAQGEAGPPGPQGLQGEVGAGSPGAQGAQGDLGIQGPQGLIGYQGTIGATSAQGFTGIQGNQGVQGPDGGGGFQGIQGNVGIQGFQGTDGGVGGAGTQGARGMQGDLGFQGPSGEQGAGVQGPRGSQGIVGAGGQGPAGPQGPAGSQVGPQGATGFQGETGAGAQGAAGTPGVGGIQGIQGTTGNNGIQGRTGSQGIQGNAGSSTGMDVASLHTSGLQGTAMFITMVQGGSGVRPLYGTTSPNPGSQQNFFYTANDDELTLENIKIDGSATLNGSTITSWPTGGGGASAINDLSDGRYLFNALGLGSGALDSSASGSLNNTAVGIDAFTSVTTADGNTGLGYHAGRLATGSYNTYIGDLVASQASSSATVNTAVGHGSLADVTTGGNNTAIGAQVMDELTTGSNNVGIGSSSLNNASFNGTAFVAVGVAAAQTSTTGTNNIVIGYQAEPSSGSISNEITLGNSNITRLRIPGLTGSATNGQVLTYNSSNGLVEFSTVSGGGGGSLNNIVEDTTPQLGGNLDGQAFNITTTGDITAANFNTTSDESLKENVETIENALSKVINMRGVNFNWVENAQPGTGVIAQEMEQVVPEVITENDQGIKHVQYGNLVGTLIEAIKEQQRQIEELQALAHPPVAPGGTTELMNMIEEIESRLDELEK